MGLSIADFTTQFADLQDDFKAGVIDKAAYQAALAALYAEYDSVGGLTEKMAAVLAIKAAMIDSVAAIGLRGTVTATSGPGGLPTAGVANGDAYKLVNVENPLDGHMFVRVSGAWVDFGPLIGATGRSAYDRAVELGYEGTEEEYALRPQASADFADAQGAAAAAAAALANSKAAAAQSVVDAGATILAAKSAAETAAGAASTSAGAAAGSATSAGAAKTGAEAARDLALATVAGKADYVPPLKVAAATAINAVRNRYSKVATPTAPHGMMVPPLTGASAAWAFNQAIYDTFGEPNVLRLTGATTSGVQAFAPVGGYFISVADLAAIGIVPNDTTPPVVSMRAAIVKNSLVNQTIDTTADSTFGQIWFILRYDGVGGSTSLNYGNLYDVTFNNRNSNPAVENGTTHGLGRDDAMWSSAVTGALINNASVKGYKCQNVKIPATYGGKALTGILILGIGRTTAAGTSQMELARAALVAGATIDSDANYFNADDKPLSWATPTELAQGLADKAAQTDLATAQAQIAAKLDNRPPLKSPLSVCAVFNRYNATGVVPSPHGPAPAGKETTTAAYVFNQALFDAYGEPNALGINADATTANGGFSPVGGYFISPADLAAIGIVPDDTTPPVISIRASILRNSLVNQSVDAAATNGQFYFILRYDGAAGSRVVNYGQANDVWFDRTIMTAPSATSVGGAATNPLWQNVVAGSITLTALEKRFAFQNIKVPATFNGKALTGILIVGIGKKTTNAASAYMEISRAAVIAGATIDQTANYLNAADNPLLGARTDLAATQVALAAETAARIAAGVGKADYIPPLKPKTYVNAVRNRFSSSGVVTPPHGSYTGGTVENVFNQALFDAVGEPNAMEGSHPLPGGNPYVPQIGYFITPADLAAIGVVPDDTTPPTISMMGALLKNATTNQTLASQQVWFVLRYAGVSGPKTISYGAATDITFNKANVGYINAPAGDARFSTLAGVAFSDSLVQGWKRENVPIPATFNGQALTGIVILGFGYAANTALPTKMQMARAALVPGSTIDHTKAFLNSDDRQVAASSVVSREDQLVRTITIANSDKIGVAGDSYTQSLYSHEGKAWISKVSLFSDWNWENFAVSGETFAKNLGRLRAGTTTYGNASYKDYGLTYAFGISGINDGAYETVDLYADDVRGFIETARGLGAIPILASEWSEPYASGFSTTLRTIAEQNGALFCDVLQNAKLFNQTKYSGFWGGNPNADHPGVRTNELIAAPVEAFINQLPRPRQGLKVFRKRTGFAVSVLDDLMFDDKIGRAKAFKEINVGHTALTNDSGLGYYDKLATGTYTTTLVQSEYLKLQAGVAVAFADYALVEVILPATQKDLTEVALVISDPSVTVYARDVLATPYETTTTYQRFDVVADPGVTVGATYTSSESAQSAQTYTYVGYWNGAAVFSPNTRGKYGSGTLTKTAGTGPSTIAYTVNTTGFDAAYYANLGKPEGHWVAVTGVAGRYTLSQSALQGKVRFDKVSLLLYKSGGFSLSSISVDWKGQAGKPAYPPSVHAGRARGAELLTTTLCNSLTGWTQEGTPTVGAPADGVLPMDPATGSAMTGRILVTNANKVRQTITYAQSRVEDREVEVRIWARRFPAIFDPATGTYPTDAAITVDTYDWATLQVDMVKGSLLAASVKRKVGLWWQEIVFRTNLATFNTTYDIRIGSADALAIELAIVSVKFVEA